MKRISLVLLLSIAGLILLAGMGGKGDEPMYREGEKIKITGMLRLVGNEPFTRLSVRVTNLTKQTDIYLPVELKKTYQSMVAYPVEAEGVFHIETIYSANHKYKIREYQLTNVIFLKKAAPSRD